MQIRTPRFPYPLPRLLSRIIALATALLLIACEPPPVVDQEPAPIDTSRPGRLPEDVVPVRYRLDLTILPDQETFSGHVEIDVRIVAPVNRIWLHGADLSYTMIEVRSASEKMTPVRFKNIGPDGLGFLELPAVIGPEDITLAFDFSAPFSDGLIGMYRVELSDDHYAFTQFETIYARKAFPSFDEPEFKTPFDIQVTTRDTDLAFSNTREVSTEALSDGFRRTAYATTEPLPTYLIAFAVGPFEVVDWQPISANQFRDRELPLRGIAVRGQGLRMAYALKATAPLIQSLEEYFAIGYPFDKLDLVAVPDFAWGGMENAGLITYLDSMILLDDPPTAAQRRSFLRLHSHELAHQWFGNLVTMDWWDDVWLNEAFSTWISAKVVDAQWPELFFDRETQISGYRAMQQDRLDSARRIREPVETADDIENAFDSITYQKGAAVLAMFENFLGFEAFRQGIRRYLADNAFGAATVFDLMAALQAESRGLDITDAFEGFLLQSGVPYIGVDLDCAGPAVTVRLRQQRYLPIGSTADAERKWEVPVCLAFGDDEGGRGEQCMILEQAEQEFSLDTTSCPSWLIPNARGAGYYRWRLPESENIRLYAVANQALNAGERISFADSLLAGLDNGTTPIGEFLEVMPLFGLALERPVITALFPTYKQLLRQLLEEPARQSAKDYVAAVYLPILGRLDDEAQWESPEEQALLRRSLTSFLALVVSVETVRAPLAESARRYIGFGADGQLHPENLSPDLRHVAFAVAVQDDGIEFTEALLGQLEQSADPQLRSDILFALANASDPGAVDIAHGLALSGQLRSNELWWYLRQSLDADSDDSWEWIQTNFEQLMPELSDRARGEGPLRIAARLCSSQQAAELEELFTPYLDEFIGSARNLRAGLEIISLCEAFRDTHAAGATRFFETRGTTP